MGTTPYCFDTDILSAVLKRDPPLHLVRSIARVPAEHQFITSITLGELLYGALRGKAGGLRNQIFELLQLLLTASSCWSPETFGTSPEFPT